MDEGKTPVILGATLLERTARGVVVGCPGCGAQEFFAPTDEPVFAPSLVGLSGVSRGRRGAPGVHRHEWE